MRKILIAVALLSVVTPAVAQKLETQDEFNRRMQSQQYQADTARGGQPLGGYNQPLGGNYGSGYGSNGAYNGSSANSNTFGTKCSGWNCPR